MCRAYAAVLATVSLSTPAAPLPAVPPRTDPATVIAAAVEDPPRELWRASRTHRPERTPDSTVAEEAAPSPAVIAPSPTRAVTAPERTVRRMPARKVRPPAPPATRRAAPPPPAFAPPSGNVAAAVGFALSQVGKPYVRNASGPGGYDCSGLVVASFRRVGIGLPHQTGALAGRGRAVSRSELRPGDLVFTSRSHVGIYVGGGRIVHAPTSGDRVRVAPIHSFVYARRIT